MKRPFLRHWVGLCLAFVLAISTRSLWSQSLEQLESEVLGGGGSAGGKTNSNPPPVVEEAPVGDSAAGANDNAAASNVPNAAAAADEEDVPSLSTNNNKKDADEKVTKEVDEFISGPKAIPLSHIFVVKQQYISKTGLHEIIPFTLGVQPADSFRKQVSFGFSYLYHLNENFAIEAAHLNFFANIKSGLQDDLRTKTGLEIDRIEPVLSGGAALHWSPFKGKSATAENIYHYEGYLFAGGGMTEFESGSSAMAMGGLGAHLFVNRRSTFKVELRDYWDFKSGAGNRLNILAGAGILLGEAKQ